MPNKFMKKLVSLSLLVTTISLSIAGVSVNRVSAATASTTTAASSTTSASTPDGSWPVAPDLVSGSAILIDADTGAILYQKDAHEKCYPASTTKIMTGLLTIENCSMNETVTFSSAAANSVTWEDANLATKAGEQYTVEQSLYGLLLYSANEIAYGLAEHVGGTLSNFVDMMNARAKQLGALDTHFNNASGLYDPNHYTTAYDMAMIARGCYNNSTFVNIDSTYTPYTIGPTNLTSQSRTFSHRHLMLKNRAYYYEYCKGGKTGFTDQSGYTLVTFAEKDDMRLICVCFKSTDTGRYADTRSLFDWGFSNFKKVTASGDAISSLFNNTSYYNSAVFSKYNLDLKLNASTLTIPSSGSVSNVSMGVDQNYSSSDDNGMYTARVDFQYSGNTVGTATLTMAAANALNAGSNLPYLSDTADTGAPSAKKCVVINIWFLAAAGVLILIGLHFLGEHKRTQRRNLHTGKRHLHY